MEHSEVARSEYSEASGVYEVPRRELKRIQEQKKASTEPPLSSPPDRGVPEVPGSRKIRLINQLTAMLRRVQGDEGSESRTRLGRARADPDGALAEAREFLTAQRKPIQVDSHDLEGFMKVILSSIEEEPRRLLAEVAAEILHDPPSRRSLDELTRDADEFEELARETARKLEPDDHGRQSLMVPFVLGGLCLVAGGVTIPLLVVSAKAELIYSNVVASTSTVCAAAFIVKDHKNKGK